eukprot:TRINITY_DN2732_c0_g3_i2.p4 TRINITY_DN2732_c0_g3~~TRINITY_DN2732_c0_g3_i2.p4  ORF type:complete len:170 (+),score=7.80 TRINITY_DN2732_c0_g3_i2:620-1129(+)
MDVKIVKEDFNQNCYDGINVFIGLKRVSSLPLANVYDDTLKLILDQSCSYISLPLYLLEGPSASGKTMFASRLSVERNKRNLPTIYVTAKSGDIKATILSATNCRDWKTFITQASKFRDVGRKVLIIVDDVYKIFESGYENYMKFMNDLRDAKVDNVLFVSSQNAVARK